MRIHAYFSTFLWLTGSRKWRKFPESLRNFLGASRKKNVDFPSFFLPLSVIRTTIYRVVKFHFYGKKLAFMTLDSFFASFNY